MPLFHKKPKTTQPNPYNKETQTPVIKASICNGEQVAGFLDLHTNKFEEVMLIQTDKDLAAFKRIYQIDGEIKTIY